MAPIASTYSDKRPHSRSRNQSRGSSLHRLPGQIEAYGKVVDRATLIAADRHIEHALGLLPEWWGVISVTQTARAGIQFKRLRSERANRSLQKLSLARLLWRGEIVDLLGTLGAEAIPEELGAQLCMRNVVSRVPMTQLRKDCPRETLKSRTNWRIRHNLRDVVIGANPAPGAQIACRSISFPAFVNVPTAFGESRPKIG